MRRHLLVGGLVALAAATWLARSLAFAPAFFHANGQGPGWIAFATEGLGSELRYGPGYPEVFGGATRWFPGEPERGVFLLQTLFAATVPVSAWVVARCSGARARWACLIALALALDPAGVRVGASESYEGVIGAGLLAAGALVAWSARRRVAAWRLEWGAVAGAGALVAVVARVHPVAWVAAATLPAVALAGRARTVGALASALVIAGLTAVVSGPALVAVLRGPLAAQYAGSMPATPTPLLLPVAALAVGAWAVRRRRVAALGLGCTLLAYELGDRMGTPNPWVTLATLRLFTPALLACLLRAVPAQRGAAWGPRAWALLALAGHGLVTGPSVLRLPTDALEARWLVAARGRLAAGSTVTGLQRSSSHVVALPFHGAATRGIHLVEDLAHATYYVHTSACSGGDGAERCRELEARATLELVDRVVLPARLSLRQAAYASPEVEVALYRVLAVQP